MQPIFSLWIPVVDAGVTNGDALFETVLERRAKMTDNSFTGG
jgi:hypothetical protein